MNALLVVAHPDRNSFSHAMAAVAGDALVEMGCALSFHDLYTEGFNPVQPVIEAENTASEDGLVEIHCAALKSADLILVFHPNWWSQPPAILKGWIDRVFRLNTAYAYPQSAGFDAVPVGLLRARAALVFNTSNTPAAREREVFAIHWKCCGERAYSPSAASVSSPDACMAPWFPAARPSAPSGWRKCVRSSRNALWLPGRSDRMPLISCRVSRRLEAWTRAGERAHAASRSARGAVIRSGTER
jgi:putative NADPH-quinone reductase